jgi:hypothetical protein
MHQKFFYNHIHEWTALIAFAATYAHPIDHVFSNMIPPGVGPNITNCHVSTLYLWFTFGIFFLETFCDILPRQAK